MIDLVRSIIVAVDDAEFRELQIAKGSQTWREFLLAKANAKGAHK